MTPFDTIRECTLNWATSEPPEYWRSHDPEPEAVIPGAPTHFPCETQLGETRNVTISAWGRPGHAAVSLTIRDKCDGSTVELDGAALELAVEKAKEVGIL